ncbi:MAG: DUF1501 domain-containing protein [Planctomycetes bacterium]|nr:DUF1501 domain-containing protein [Planctomycetota bacterium]
MHRILATHDVLQSRRRFLKAAAVGLGATALGALLPGALRAQGGPRRGDPHHAPRARRVIFLFMAGAPSQLDLFDYKPDLERQFRQPLPPSVSMGQRVTAMTRGRSQLVAPSMFGFRQSPASGVWWSELLPHLSAVSDRICVVHTLNTNAINHDPAKTFICTGSEIPGKASMGAWLSYGLGSMNRDLPDFVVLTSAFWTGGKRNVQGLYSRLWGSGFLPSRHQGTAFQTVGDPVLFLSNPDGVDPAVRRRMLDAVAELNHKHQREIGDPEIRTTIAQQEMAFRMQSSVPALTDLSDEPDEVLALYGPEVHKTGSFARNCLLARRMIERDVRFVQINHRGWDHHSILPQQLPGQCFDVDQPSAALIRDLERRGLLDDTLIVFAGEFGRTVFCQGRLERDDYGRDHHPRCFSGWLAGGGIQGGIAHGRTDDFSYNVVEDPVGIHDLHATMLYLLGIDHERLTFPFQGLDQRLTGVEPARVVHEMLS